MEINATGGGALASNVGTALGTEAAEAQGLNRDAFLQLLLTQLANQDPLEPIKDQAFVAQLAQFSSLQRLEEIAASTDALVALTQSRTLSDESSSEQATEG